MVKSNIGRINEGLSNNEIPGIFSIGKMISIERVINSQ